MRIPAERFFQRLRHVLDHADFIFIAVGKDSGYVLFKLDFGFYHAITKEVINRNGQSICKAYNRGQTDACGASLDVAHVCRRNLNHFG